MAKDKLDAGALLAIHLRELGLSFEREYRFCPWRKWRADFMVVGSANPFRNPSLVEIEGAVWTQGRHTRGAGYTGDMEKYNVASAMHFHVFRFTTNQVVEGSAKALLKEYFEWLTA